MKSKNILCSFKYAIQGIISSFKSERNMKLHFGMLFVVLGMGFLLKIKTYEWIICLILFALVIAGELFNTAIEVVVDLAMPDKNPKAKLAKDISAGAVLILTLFSGIIGLIIFIPKLLFLGK